MVGRLYPSDNANSLSFLVINLQQRFHGQSGQNNVRPENGDVILDAANNITRLVEDAMIYWSPEYFPMMWYVCERHIYPPLA